MLGDKSLGDKGRRNSSPRVTRLILRKSLSLRQIFVAAISCTNSNQFATKLAKAELSHSACVHFGNKSLRQIIYEPMRERHIEFGRPPIIPVARKGYG